MLRMKLFLSFLPRLNSTTCRCCWLSLHFTYSLNAIELYQFNHFALGAFQVIHLLCKQVGFTACHTFSSRLENIVIIPRLLPLLLYEESQFSRNYSLPIFILRLALHDSKIFFMKPPMKILLAPAHAKFECTK